MKRTGEKRLRITALSLCIFLLCLLMPGLSWGLGITAQVDKTTLSLQDSLYLKVIANGGKADPDMSVIRDFKVFPRGTSSSYQYINGQSENKTIYQFLLVPQAEGELTIPPIPVQIKGQAFFTQPITVRVTDQVVDPDQVRPLFAQADVLADTLFAGQQTVYTVKFFTSRSLGGLGFETRPEFKGLTARSFESEKSYTLNVKDQPYRVTQLDYLIIPPAPGSYTIDPVGFIAKVRVAAGQDPFFDSFFNDSIFSAGQYKQVRVRSNPVHIEVSPLPEYTGDTPFSGLIGTFDIQVQIDKTRLKVGDSATLSIRVNGTGNIMDAGLPPMDLTGLGFKIYDDTPADDIQLTPAGYQGTRTFKKALVAVEPGQYRMDRLELVYFDVAEKSYRTITGPVIQLDVEADASPSAPAALPDAPSQPDKVIKQDVSLLNNDILDIREGLYVLEDIRPLTPVRFLLLLFFPGLVFLLLKGILVFRKKEVSRDKQMQDKSKRCLKLAAKSGTRDETFLAHLYTALVAAILAKGKQVGEAVTVKETQTILSRAGAGEPKIREMIDLLQTIESIRFGNRKIDEHSAGRLFSRVKKALKTLGCLVAAVLITAGAPEPVQATVAGQYTDAVEHYKAGRFYEAARSFEAIANQPTRNPYLYYNIGNAYLKAEDIGRAILWYERARLMAPSKPDLIYNLAHANTLVKDRADPTVDYLELLFFWDRLVGVKTIQYTAVLLSVLFFVWAGVRTVRRQTVFSGIGLILAVLLFLGTGLSGLNYYKQTFRKTAVIIAEQVNVRSGTTGSATPLFTLNAGTVVRVEERRGEYLKIAFSKERIGWVHSNDAGIVQQINE